MAAFLLGVQPVHAGMAGGAQQRAGLIADQKPWASDARMCLVLWFPLTYNVKSPIAVGGGVGIHRYQLIESG